MFAGFHANMEDCWLFLYGFGLFAPPLIRIFVFGLFAPLVPGSLFDTRRSLSSGPGPGASKQLAARDGYLSAVSQLKSVPAHAGRRCIPLWECRLLL